MSELPSASAEHDAGNPKPYTLKIPGGIGLGLDRIICAVQGCSSHCLLQGVSRACHLPVEGLAGQTCKLPAERVWPLEILSRLRKGVLCTPLGVIYVHEAYFSPLLISGHLAYPFQDIKARLSWHLRLLRSDNLQAPQAKQPATSWHAVTVGCRGNTSSVKDSLLKNRKILLCIWASTASFDQRRYLICTAVAPNGDSMSCKEPFL